MTALRRLAASHPAPLLRKAPHVPPPPHHPVVDVISLIAWVVMLAVLLAAVAVVAWAVAPTLTKPDGPPGDGEPSASQAP